MLLASKESETGTEDLALSVPMSDRWAKLLMRDASAAGRVDCSKPRAGAALEEGHVSVG